MNQTRFGGPIGRRTAPHAHDENLCTYCLASLSRSRHPIFDWLFDCAYSARELWLLLMQRLWLALEGLPQEEEARRYSALSARRIPAHSHESGQILCTVCLGSWRSTGIALFDSIRERLWDVAMALTLVGKFFGIILFGMAMIAVSLFPRLLGERRHDPDADRARAEWDRKRRKQHDWEKEEQRRWDEKKRAQHAWEDERRLEWEERENELHDWRERRQSDPDTARTGEWQIKQNDYHDRSGGSRQKRTFDSFAVPRSEAPISVGHAENRTANGP